MRIPWPKSKVEQLDLIEDESSSASAGLVEDTAEQAPHAETCVARSSLSIEALRSEGVPLQVPLDSLVEDPGNPRTEFPDAEIAELAEDIALRILQPIVVRQPDHDGRYPCPLRSEASARRKEGRPGGGPDRHRRGGP